MRYQTATLPSGLRIIHLPSDSSVVYCGYQIAAGTRNEAAGEEGLAHLAEHMTFKGTERRSARQVVNAVERVGGELNAFTTKEDTTFYAAIGREHLRQAIDVLTDMVFCSTYPQAELDKEIEVVCDEIESYNDTPAELIYDDFENLIFPNHPLGHNILGQAEQLRSYTHDDVARFTERHYRPDNAVFFAYGNIDFTKLVEKLKSHWTHRAQKPQKLQKHENTLNLQIPCPPQDSSPIIRQLSTHQAHVMVGTRAFGYDHPHRTALALLTNILGGTGLNSRLNVSLRERHGLVYTVEALQVNYTDTGVWSVYFGCDPSDVKRCLRLVNRELNRLTEKPLSAVQLRAAKRQMSGQVMIACDNREQAALDFAKLYLHHGRERDIDDLLRKIESVSADELLATARELFNPDRLVTLIYQ